MTVFIIIRVFFYSCAQGKSFIYSIKEHLALLLIGKRAFVLTDKTM